MNKKLKNTLIYSWWTLCTFSVGLDIFTHTPLGHKCLKTVIENVLEKQRLQNAEKVSAQIDAFTKETCGIQNKIINLKGKQLKYAGVVALGPTETNTRLYFIFDERNHAGKYFLISDIEINQMLVTSEQTAYWSKKYPATHLFSKKALLSEDERSDLFRMSSLLPDFASEFAMPLTIAGFKGDAEADPNGFVSISIDDKFYQKILATQKLYDTGKKPMLNIF